MALCAAVDLGSNSLRLLVARVENGQVEPLHRELRTTRLGEGLRPGFSLAPAAMERSLAALLELRDTVSKFEIPAARTKVVATSAVREAENGRDFAAKVSEATGWTVRVLSGREEAALSYRGAISVLGRPAVVMDIGGRSTEVIVPVAKEGLPEGSAPECFSFPLGALRCTEEGTPPAAMAEVLGPAIEQVAGRRWPLVGVGGTLTTLAAIYHRLEVYDPEVVHGTFLPLEVVDALVEQIASLPLEERRRLPGLQPQRADIIVAGGRICQVIMHRGRFSGVTVSEADLLWGVILEEAQIL